MPYVLHTNRAWREGCAWHCEARLNLEYPVIQTIVLPVWRPHVSRCNNESYSIWHEVLLGPIRRRRNTPAFGTDFFSRSFFWRRFVSPTRIDCGASLLASCSALIRKRRRFDCARRFSFPLSVRRYLSSARFLAAFRTSSLAIRRQFSPQKTWAG